jgi:hypothetical protein
LNINAAIFKVRKYNANLITGEKIIPSENKYTGYVDYRILTKSEYYINRFNYTINNSLTNIKCINGDTGYIEPLDRTIIVSTYNKPSETNNITSTNISVDD